MFLSTARALSFFTCLRANSLEPVPARGLFSFPLAAASAGRLIKKDAL